MTAPSDAQPTLINEPKRAWRIWALVLGGVILLGQVLPAATPLIGAVRWSCSVGALGFAANVTASGPFAGTKCQSILQNPKSALKLDSMNIGPGDVYELTSPQGLVVCEYQEGLIRMTVRDQGALNIIGNLVCRQRR